MEQKGIAIIAAFKYTSILLEEELRSLFGLEEEIQSYYLDEEERGRPQSQEYYTEKIRSFGLSHCRLILYSSETVRRLAEKALEPGSPSVVSRRNVEMDRLPEIISIESGTDVHAFGSSREAAMELIAELQEIGISHLNLIPYYPGAGAASPNIVITPGKIFPQMEGARRIIDIGFRNLSIATVMEIFVTLDLPAEKLFRVEGWYQGELRRLNQYNTMINKSMTGILEAINEGIFCVDQSGRVLFCNRIFLNLTGTDYYDVLGRDYREISFGPELMGIINYKGDVFSDIIDYRDKKLLVNRQKNQGEGTKDAGFILSIQDVTRISEMETDVRKKLARKGFVAKYTLDKLIGKSPVIQNKIQEIHKVAVKDYTVLLTGDNGTGKEMFAQAIHNESERARHPFVAVNLASLSDNIVESEIFGYEEGAFTGALKGGKAGLFEMAHNGTIFIDEIGDVSLHIQQRLLRVLQEREVMRVGGNRVIPVNVRVVAATNRNLFELVQAGKFRIDLYYRLKVLHIHVPRLAERPEDIPLFLVHFFHEIRSSKKVSKEAMEILQQYSWPGNVRELQNLVYYLETLCMHNQVQPEDLPEEFQGLLPTSPGGVKPIFPETVAYAYGGGESSEESFQEVLSFCTERDIEDFAYILGQFAAADKKGFTLGRNRLSEMSQTRSQGGFSVEQLRRRFQKLESFGLVSTGKTKQGSSITQKGKEFINYLNRREP